MHSQFAPWAFAAVLFCISCQAATADAVHSLGKPSLDRGSHGFEGTRSNSEITAHRRDEGDDKNWRTDWDFDNLTTEQIIIIVVSASAAAGILVCMGLAMGYWCTRGPEGPRPIQRPKYESFPIIPPPWTEQPRPPPPPHIVTPVPTRLSLPPGQPSIQTRAPAPTVPRYSPPAPAPPPKPAVQAPAPAPTPAIPPPPMPPNPMDNMVPVFVPSEPTQPAMV